LERGLEKDRSIGFIVSYGRSFAIYFGDRDGTIGTWIG